MKTYPSPWAHWRTCRLAPATGCRWSDHHHQDHYPPFKQRQYSIKIASISVTVGGAKRGWWSCSLYLILNKQRQYSIKISTYSTNKDNMASSKIASISVTVSWAKRGWWSRSLYILILNKDNTASRQLPSVSRWTETEQRDGLVMLSLHIQQIKVNDPLTSWGILG